MPDQVTDVRLLDDGYSREVRSLFYHAYRHEPTFAYLMDAQRAGYDQRVRACVREMVERHLGEELPAIGLFIDDRLVAAALITPPQRRLDITESWSWRLRMLFSVGLAATRRYLDYHRAVQACLPVGPHHQLPMLGVHPEYQGRQIGEQLLAVGAALVRRGLRFAGAGPGYWQCALPGLLPAARLPRDRRGDAGSGARARPPASWRDAGGDLSVPPDAREKPCLSGAWRHKTRMSGGGRRRPRKSGRAPPACVASAP